MSTVPELADQMRAGLLDAVGGNSEKVVDADRMVGAMCGLFLQEVQEYNFDPAGYTIPEEIRDYAADRLRRVMDDAYAKWDAYQQTLQQ